MNRFAIIAAMAGELKPLVRGWQHERREGVDLWRWDSLDDEGEVSEWVAACAGAGVEAATRAFAEIERDGPISMAITTGWAGALSEEFVPGRAYVVSGVVDARTGERFKTGDAADSGDCSPRFQNRDLGHPGLWLVTSSRVAGVKEKQRLGAAYGAGLVDMEAAGVADWPGCEVSRFIASRESATVIETNYLISTALSHRMGGFNWAGSWYFAS